MKPINNFCKNCGAENSWITAECSYCLVTLNKTFPKKIYLPWQLYCIVRMNYLQNTGYYKPNVSKAELIFHLESSFVELIPVLDWK